MSGIEASVIQEDGQSSRPVNLTSQLAVWGLGSPQNSPTLKKENFKSEEEQE